MVTFSKEKKKKSDEKVLQVNNLQVSFRTYGGEVEAVRGVNFDLYRGAQRGDCIVPCKLFWRYLSFICGRGRTIFCSTVL